MSQTSQDNTDLLFPLSMFEGVSGQGTTSATVIPEGGVPEPYHRLLVHDRDMTGTLEAHFGQAVVLHVLKKRLEDGIMFRQVLLRGRDDGRAVEFGAIRIDLGCFSEAGRRLIQECREPLGAILRDLNMPYTSKPSAFLDVDADTFVREVLGAGSSTRLYGRKNTLTAEDGRVIAQIIEVLPPLPPA